MIFAFAGTSKSAVTAGLIGGRVGNKGGVGISLNIDGTTFLLINAHLAGWMFVDGPSKSILIVIIYNSSRRQGASSTSQSDQDQGGVIYL